MVTSPDLPLFQVRAEKTCRIIPTLYPPLDLFERLAPPEDWEALIEIESMTNDRLRDQAGEISLIPLSERASGPGATTIIAAFSHPGPSRFSDGSYGVYYAALDLETAIFESAVSRGRFFADSAEPPTIVQMRVHHGTVNGQLHDVRGGWPEVHAPDDHTSARALGARLRTEGSFGLIYDSVRRKIGECIAVFRPSILANQLPQGHTWPGPLLTYHWNGERVDKYFNHQSGEWIELP